MRAAVITRFGPPEVLQFRDLPSPSLMPGGVRVRVHAIGLNFADVMARLGVYPSIPKPPFVPGIEFTGEVVEIAPGVRSVRRGDRVMGFSRQGAYAEEVCVPAGFVRRVPDGMSDHEAAAFTVTYLSAYHGLRTLARVARGETVVVHAAAGGVGTAALQLLKHWGARSIATASTEEKLAVARAHGADETLLAGNGRIERRLRELTGGRGVDVVLDSVGGSLYRDSWRSLATMGRYVLFGFASVTGRRRLGRWKLLKEILATPLVFPPTLPSRNISLMGFNLYFLAERSEYLQSAAAELLKLWKKGAIKPFIGRVVPFDELVDAHAWMQSRKSTGKVVIDLTASC
ncbi:MAG: NADPH:quinone oxidoreductase family protein [Bacteroidetes bacterium]|jgi:NADPH:quinone reductase-like Zn-dependent oxidoreductase|nr:NADPH:quinone oxidoreductase family protein [Bacteroidota bacterium]